MGKWFWLCYLRNPGKIVVVDTTGNRRSNLILIGFMGTGKTCVGQRVAKSLGFRFVDTDALIVKKAGKPIAAIFEESGEDAFRELETAVLQSCASKKNQVISTGGGIVTRPENIEILRNAGYVIWLRASVETILERTGRHNDRPLLATPDPAATVRKLMGDREELYRSAAHLPISTDDLTLDETTYGVAESARLEFAACRS